MTTTKNKDVPSTKEAPSAEKRKPIKTIRVGDVSASIWERTHQTNGETLTFYSISFERSYKKRGDDENRYTKSFNPDSLERLVTAAQEASEYLHNLENPDSMLPRPKGELVPV